MSKSIKLTATQKDKILRLFKRGYGVNRLAREFHTISEVIQGIIRRAIEK